MQFISRVQSTSVSLQYHHEMKKKLSYSLLYSHKKVLAVDTISFLQTKIQSRRFFTVQTKETEAIEQTVSVR